MRGGWSAFGRRSALEQVGWHCWWKRRRKRLERKETYLRPLDNTVLFDQGGCLDWIRLGSPVEEFLLGHLVFLVDAHVELDELLLRLLSHGWEDAATSELCRRLSAVMAEIDTLKTRRHGVIIDIQR